jgi:hypothetical protein
MDGFYEYQDVDSEDASRAVKSLGWEAENEWASALLQALYVGGNLPIPWECLKPSPLYVLLNHSDTDGSIPADACAGLADALEELMLRLPEGTERGDYRAMTKTFITGLRLAASKGHDVTFG